VINPKPEILQALESNQALVSLLSGEKIYWLVAGDDELPYVTYFELANFDTDFSDDEAAANNIEIQVDVWTKGNPQKIAEEVNRTMVGLGYYRYGAADLYEDDTKIYHKVLRYEIKKMRGEG